MINIDIGKLDTHAQRESILLLFGEDRDVVRVYLIVVLPLHFKDGNGLLHLLNRL